MYCAYCGNYIDDNSAYCPYCGAQQNAQNQYVQYQYAPNGYPSQYVQYQYVPNGYPSQKTNTLAIVGFIFSFFFALIGLICSILGYREAPRCGGRGRGLAIAGIVISILSMLSAIVIYIVIFTTLGAWLL